MSTLRKDHPCSIVLSQHVTEKAQVLANLQHSESNRCVARCKSPKAVFLVDPRANKRQIAQAVEEIYREERVKVVKVNTITIHRKGRRVRGRSGFKAGYKKAVVTLEPGDRLEAV